jgi:hypothetical protein
MLINCTTKGCLQSTEAKLDRDTEEVICDSCGNAISNVTSFTKKALSSVGQVLRNKARKPFQQQCPTCRTGRSLFVREERAYCEVCSRQISVTAAFLQGLKIHLAGKEKEEDA